ncbi:hypothetical protein OAR97_02585 [Arcobacteraceae bacterium]|nr:hypothetical protein [Arcobacteraceae bacterium]
MKNTSIKNILILALSLFAIMLIATLIVIGFNFFIGLSTDVQNDDVATSIATVAFAIAVGIRYLYDKI